MEPTPATLWLRLKPNLPIIIGGLLLGYSLSLVPDFIFRLLSGKGPATTTARSSYTKKQIKQADTRQAARMDSAAMQELTNNRIAKVRDSALVAANQQQAAYTRTLKRLHHEAAPARALPASRLAELLTNYQPKTYILPSGDTLR